MCVAGGAIAFWYEEDIGRVALSKEELHYKFGEQKIVLLQSPQGKVMFSRKMIGLVFLALLGAAGNAQLCNGQLTQGTNNTDMTSSVFTSNRSCSPIG